MNFFAIISSLLFLTVSFGRSQEVLPPDHITVETASNAVALFWDEVDGAAQYYISLGNQSQITSETRAAIGGLEANTEYVVQVFSADENGTAYEGFTEVTFTTLLPKVRDLRVVVATESTIEIMWEMREDANNYRIMVKNDDDVVIEPDVSIEDNNAFISGLMGMTFYKLYVTPVGVSGEGDTALIRTRTDGSGIEVNALWEGFYGVFGGEVMVYRPLVVPDGHFTVAVTFPCPLQRAKVWNAKLIPEESSYPEGIVVMRQRKMWQKRKTQIGMNFYFDLTGEQTFCNVANDSITVDFGSNNDDATDGANLPVNTPVPVQVQEWITVSHRDVPSAGIVYVRLMDTFNDTNTVNATNPKPSFGQFIIAINSGPGCPGGLRIRHSWSMTQKSSEGMEGAIPSMAYFIQERNDWYSNQPGLIYGYDPSNCPDRSGITALVMQGGPFVEVVLAADGVSEG